MSDSTLAKSFEPHTIESQWGPEWEKRGYAAPAIDPNRPDFAIQLPPPNVTGTLHMGHAFNQTIMDGLARYHRMLGDNTLWVPGTDHAGIATQIVVERQLDAQGVSRHDLGREKFVERVWEWKEQSGSTITRQVRRLGASTDWSSEYFTMDDKMSAAVRDVFVTLYEQGLIYRGKRLVNWDPVLLTAVSDLEVASEEENGHLWHIRYPLANGSGTLTVATTRPETMLGDVAVMVHPEDERYAHLIGQHVKLPLTDREIPVIADDYVDREFGTGVVKITPAHDPNDFEVGKRHNLPEIDVMTDDAHTSEAAGKYAGLERFVARARIVADLEELGLIEKIAEHTHSIGTCDRCKAIVEPRVSTQWFMKMKPLAEPAKKVILDGLIEVVPDNQRTILLNWLENIRDWCISRQLWWGHRIPIWHCAGCKEMIPALDSRVEIVDGHARVASPPVKCPKCGGSRLPQDKDVLDTWFSSGLWPFSTLGWPDDTPDLRTYYPTSLLISGYDILFFWDARMIMMGLHLSAARFESSVGGLSSIADLACLESSSGGRSFSSGVTSATTEGASAPEGILAETIPFHRLYLHSLVRTAEGAKMSKTKGTGVDPLQLTDQYGTDAMRYMLASMSAPGTDIILSEDRILGARAFANKIWNAARFLFFNLEKIEAQGVTLEELASPEIRAKAPYLTKGESDLVHRWMFSRLSAVAREATKALEDFRFHEACHLIYQFFWGDFCDWYIEWVKPQLADANREIAFAAWRNIFAAFDAALRLLHPIMPFLTEELWHKLPQRATARSIALDKFPEPRTQWTDDDAKREMATLQEIIIAARNIRAEMKVDQKKKIAADFSSADPAIRALVQQNLDPLLRLASLSALQISSGRLDSAGAALRSTAQFDLRIAYGDTIDKAAEVARLTKERDRLSKDIASKKARLADETFLSKAPTKIVDELKATLVSRQIEHQKVLNCLAQLE